MLNAYPDSIGGSLGDMVKFFQTPGLKGVFRVVLRTSEHFQYRPGQGIFGY